MFDLIIPCLFAHLDKLYLTLESFNNNNLINEIIIILNNVENNVFDKKKFNIFKNIEFLIYNDKIFPGIARQIGIKHSSSDYIIFHDADDEPHPDKILILKNCFEKYKCDHILHFFQPLEFKFINYNPDRCIDNIICTKDIIDFHKKYNSVNFGNIINQRVSHGLIAVKKSSIIDIEWVNKKSGEDKDFNLKSLLKGNKLIIIDCFLSKYDKYHTKMMKKYNNNAWMKLKNYLI